MNRKALVHRLRVLADEMIAVGSELNYYGGFSEMAAFGEEMAQSGYLVRGWVDVFEDEIENERGKSD